MDTHEAIRKWTEAMNEGRLDRFVALYATDAVLETPLARVEGRQGVKQYDGALASAFPDASLKTPSVVVSGDIAAVEWEYSGKHTGPLAMPTGTIPPTNRSFSLRGTSFLRFNPQGLIKDERRYYDTRSLFDQLGLK